MKKETKEEVEEVEVKGEEGKDVEVAVEVSSHPI